MYMFKKCNPIKQSNAVAWLRRCLKHVGVIGIGKISSMQTNIEYASW